MKIDNELKVIHDELKALLKNSECSPLVKITVLLICKRIKILYLAQRSKRLIVENGIL